MSRTIRFFSMYYISSRILENLPFEIYSHLIEKGQQTNYLLLTLFLFRLFIAKIPDINKNTGASASPVLIKVKQGYMLCVVYTY